MLLLALWATLATIASTTGEICVSQGNRFPKFSLEGWAPRKSPRGTDALKLCRIFSGRTCCTGIQTQHALLALRNLAVNGEGDEVCQSVWEVLECSVCHPRVGTSPGPPAICQDFCNVVFSSCSSAFFAMDQPKQALLPCGSSEIICAQGTEWTRNSSHFCELAGFRVVERASGEFCYDGTPGESLEKTSPSSKDQKKKKQKKQDRTPSPESPSKKFDRAFLMTDKVLWAVAGLVLTAGAVLFRQRGSRSRQRRAALMKSLKEARSSQQAAYDKKS
ncbi:uncharacterized protein LOC9654190 [Selaginella moellendorffii]|uniref:uncharacterized protein LOC9654190 n=1 Tax=Selaginella moellendorffii TaxID=88036 RepID=UPI000D1C9525|nr:uncharacterized protein LOC9654190 [Selaginella moellendorffii]|eukprot:XP_024543825.1 uncharacterized protein LOC9654190 [Selaginella moellendorffii]